MALALIALGSNLGDRAATFDTAIAAIRSLPQTQLTAKSAWIESAPVGPPGQPVYLNGAALIETSLEPAELLNRLQQIEATAGRVRSVRWGPRTLDLDLLLYDDTIAWTERLTLPHPRMAWRRFVLAPAAQIAAKMLHPTSGITIGELFARFASTLPYLAIMGPPGSGKTRLAMEIARQSGCRVILDPVGNARCGVPPLPADSLDSGSRNATEGVPCRNDLITGAESALQPSYSASPELNREIEFLARRMRLLAADDAAADDWKISDFWLRQSLAWSEVDSTPELASQVEAVYRQFAKQAMPARFVALLDVSPISSTTSATELVAGDEGVERLRAAMRSLVKRPGQPPAVWLSSNDWEGAVAELLGVLAG
jgi:2-amino-4-hydroxy-6-hydroxymethyldihydropteridine diphosphokinase